MHQNITDSKEGVTLKIKSFDETYPNTKAIEQDQLTDYIESLISNAVEPLIERIKQLEANEESREMYIQEQSEYTLES